MVDWHFWLILAAMLGVGRIAGVGIYMAQFAIAALISGGSAAFLPYSLETQLHLFLFTSLVQTATLYLRTRRRRGV